MKRTFETHRCFALPWIPNYCLHFVGSIPNNLQTLSRCTNKSIISVLYFGSVKLQKGEKSGFSWYLLFEHLFFRHKIRVNLRKQIRILWQIREKEEHSKATENKEKSIKSHSQMEILVIKSDHKHICKHLLSLSHTPPN